MLNLFDLQRALRLRLTTPRPAPCHVTAFAGWIAGDVNRMSAGIGEALAFTGQARHPEHVAALGYGAYAGALADAMVTVLRDEISHLGGRTFFAPGRAPRFEVDGIALLGVALGAARLLPPDEAKWLNTLLARSSQEVRSDIWQLGLVRLAQTVLGYLDLHIVPSDLAVAAAARGLGSLQASDREPAWQLVTSLTENEGGLARDATQLAVFDYELSRIAQVDLASATRDDLIQVLQSASRGMKRWTFEHVKRTAKSEITRWHVDNEYHVQNLLWAILAPVFPDLEDEENLPSIGQMHPRADLGVPSLRTLIEVKFLRHRGQSGFTKIIEEIAADTSLYLSRTTEYDNIIAFVWDDCAQTEQHHELKSGIERIRGISAAIILPRPSSMARVAAGS